MMDCDQFREVLADLDRPGVLTAELREQAFAHAEACGDCGQLLTETESLDAELRRLAEREDDSRAPARVEAHLLNEFRRGKAEAARQTTWRYAAAIGIAAVLLLAAGFWLNRRTTGNVVLPSLHVAEPVAVAPPRAQSTSNPSTPSGETAIATPGEVQAAYATQSATKTGNPDAADTDALVPDDSAAEFIPLPDADPAPLEDGAVVRVEMPRAALASFGLPVEAMEGDGTVRADLIVSADGTPQAIRLISQDGASAVQR